MCPMRRIGLLSVIIKGVPYVLLENASGRFLCRRFQGDVTPFWYRASVGGSFPVIGDVLRREGFPLNSIIRQLGNYIERITAFDGQDQHYQAFNNARSAFYSKTEWTNGYPAATGIGANLGGILIDVDAAVFTTPDAFATPIDNKLRWLPMRIRNKYWKLPDKEDDP